MQLEYDYLCELGLSDDTAWQFMTNTPMREYFYQTLIAVRSRLG